jgi:hypothetical protein
MKGFVPPDPETSVSQEHFAVIMTPRQNRKRFPAACVEIVEGEQAAIEKAVQQDKCFAARVVGPSKSSEGQYIYYLMEWLASE